MRGRQIGERQEERREAGKEAECVCKRCDVLVVVRPAKEGEYM